MPVRSKLTPRQYQVAVLVPQGLSNRQIGTQLAIKESVVKNYLREIFDRLGVFNRLELAVYVVQWEKLVKPTPEPAVQYMAPPRVCRSRMHLPVVPISEPAPTHRHVRHH